MKKIVVFMLIFGCARGMDKEVHSIDGGMPLYDYWAKIDGVDLKKVTMSEAHKFCEFMQKKAQDEPAVLNLTPQQLAKCKLEEVYLLLHGKKLEPLSRFSLIAKRQLIEESGRTIEAILRYLIDVKNPR